MRILWQDLKYTFRQLRNAPVWAATAVLTLALGLGATTAMLAIVDSVLVRPVNLPHAERVMTLGQVWHGRPAQQFELAEADALARVKSFEALAVANGGNAATTTRDGSRIDSNISVNAGFFRTAGVAPLLGRVLLPQDEHQPVAVINDLFWQRRMHGDPHVLGSTFKIKDRQFTVVGVLPPGFAMPQGFAGEIVFTPLGSLTAEEATNSFVGFTARLRPGVSQAAAQAEAAAIHARFTPKYKEFYGPLFLRPYRELLVEDERPGLLALLGGCFLVLLIACANAANLQIARGLTRVGEMRTRAALGAGRSRLVRQVATESIIVSALGAALGLLLASGIVAWVKAAYTVEFSRFNELAIRPEVFALCALLAVLAGALAALAPAWSAARNAGTLSGAPGSQVTRRSRLTGGLVAVEIALTCVLLLTAGLFLRSYRYLAHAPFGFDTSHVTGITLMPNVTKESPEAARTTEDRLLSALQALPGVESAGSEEALPYSRFLVQWQADFHFIGGAPTQGEQLLLNVASDRLFTTLHVPLRQGRSFTRDDTAGTQPVCVVNEAFARKFLQGKQAVGRLLALEHGKESDGDPFFAAPRLIVGVVADEIAYRSRPTLYVPAAQIPAASELATVAFGLAPQFAVRSALPQAALERELRTAIKQAAPDMAEMNISPLADNLDFWFTKQKLALRLASAFGLLALALAAVGIYGVLASSVAQRTREIGIRIALGASRGQAMGLVLRQAARMVLAGLALGLAFAWPAGRAVKAFLSGVTPLDPLSLTLAALTLLGVCAAAALIPAARAARVDPVIALRAE